MDLRSVDAGSADARQCLRAYFTELSARTGVAFHVVRDLRQRPVGCAGLKRRDGFAVLKRMWVDPSSRGIGVGRRLLEHIDGLARAEGIQLLRLDTNAALNEAIALCGVGRGRRGSPYTQDPFATNWFEKTLR